jgi:hypothetical protein
VPVVEAAAAIAIYDLILENDWIEESLANVNCCL